MLVFMNIYIYICTIRTCCAAKNYTSKSPCVLSKIAKSILIVAKGRCLFENAHEKSNCDAHAAQALPFSPLAASGLVSPLPH